MLAPPITLDFSTTTRSPASSIAFRPKFACIFLLIRCTRLRTWQPYRCWAVITRSTAGFPPAVSAAHCLPCSAGYWATISCIFEMTFFQLQLTTTVPSDSYSSAVVLLASWLSPPALSSGSFEGWVPVVRKISALMIGYVSAGSTAIFEAAISRACTFMISFQDASILAYLVSSLLPDFCAWCFILGLICAFWGIPPLELEFAGLGFNTVVLFYRIARKGYLFIYNKPWSSSILTLASSLCPSHRWIIAVAPAYQSQHFDDDGVFKVEECGVQVGVGVAPGRSCPIYWEIRTCNGWYGRSCAWQSA